MINSKEANEMSKKNCYGINNILKKVEESIINSCNNGKYETIILFSDKKDVDYLYNYSGFVSEELIKLGYKPLFNNEYDNNKLIKNIYLTITW